MTNKLHETEAKEMLRAATSVISALGQYFDPAFKQLSVALCVTHDIPQLDRALCVEGSLVMIPQKMVEDGFEWAALDPNGDIYAYKREPRFGLCNCGNCENPAGWSILPTFDTEPVRFLRCIDPVSTETAKQRLFYVGEAN